MIPSVRLALNSNFFRLCVLISLIILIWEIGSHGTFAEPIIFVCSAIYAVDFLTKMFPLLRAPQCQSSNQNRAKKPK